MSPCAVGNPQGDLGEVYSDSSPPSRARKFTRLGSFGSLAALGSLSVSFRRVHRGATAEGLGSIRATMGLVYRTLDGHPVQILFRDTSMQGSMASFVIAVIIYETAVAHWFYPPPEDFATLARPGPRIAKIVNLLPPWMCSIAVAKIGYPTGSASSMPRTSGVVAISVCLALGVAVGAGPEDHKVHRGLTIMFHNASILAVVFTTPPPLMFTVSSLLTSIVCWCITISVQIQWLYPNDVSSSVSNYSWIAMAFVGTVLIWHHLRRICHGGDVCWAMVFLLGLSGAATLAENWVSGFLETGQLIHAQVFLSVALSIAHAVLYGVSQYVVHPDRHYLQAAQALAFGTVFLFDALLNLIFLSVDSATTFAIMAAMTVITTFISESGPMLLLRMVCEREAGVRCARACSIMMEALFAMADGSMVDAPVLGAFVPRHVALHRVACMEALAWQSELSSTFADVMIFCVVVVEVVIFEASGSPGDCGTASVCPPLTATEPATVRRYLPVVYVVLILVSFISSRVAALVRPWVQRRILSSAGTDDAGACDTCSYPEAVVDASCPDESRQRRPSASTASAETIAQGNGPEFHARLHWNRYRMLFTCIMLWASTRVILERGEEVASGEQLRLSGKRRSR